MKKFIVLLMLTMVIGCVAYADIVTTTPVTNSAPDPASLTQQQMDSLIYVFSKSDQFKRLVHEEAETMFSSYLTYVGVMITFFTVVISVLLHFIPNKKNSDKTIDKKIREIEETIEQYSKEAIASFIFTQAKYESDLDKRIAILSNAIKENPKYAEAYYHRGEAYFAKSETEKAKEDYNKAIEIKPQFPEPYIGLGVIYNNIGDTDNAEMYYNKAKELNPQNAEPYVNLAKLYLEKDVDAAMRFLDDAIRLNPQYDNAYYDYGIAYYKKRNYDAAIKMLNRVIQRDPRSYESYNALGQVYSAKGNYNQAVSAYNEAIKLNPQYAEAYNNRGKAYYALGNPKAAKKDFRKVINESKEKNRQCFEAYKNLAKTIMAKKNGQIDEIKDKIKLFIWGVDRNDEAIELYSKALDIEPGDADACIKRGVAYMKRGRLGDYELAKKDYEKAFLLNPDERVRKDLEQYMAELEEKNGKQSSR